MPEEYLNIGWSVFFCGQTAMNGTDRNAGDGFGGQRERKKMNLNWVPVCFL